MAPELLSSTGRPMRATRQQTGNSKPRTFPDVPTTVTEKKKTKKAATTKANTSKPRSDKTTTGRVTKKKAPTKKDKTVKEKVESKINGAVEKAEGAVEGKPGKKVRTALVSASTVMPATPTVRTRSMRANVMLTPGSENDTLPASAEKENAELTRYNARMTAPDRDYFHPNIGLFYVTQAAGATKAKTTKGAKPKKETKS
jgi:hypothetical protein